MLSNKRQVSDVETGRDQVSYRAVNLVLPKSQVFDAEPGEDQVSYRAVTFVLLLSVRSRMPSLVKTRSRIEP
jgi:hypothetical protein